MNTTQPEPTPSVDETVALTPTKGFVVLVILVATIGAFLALSSALAIVEPWVGCLFLLYWGGIEKADLKKLASSAVGAAVGLLMAYLLQRLPLWLGESTAGLVFLAGLVVLIYCLLMGWLQTVVNMATMLFITIATIPSIQSSYQFDDALIALTFSVAYFAGLIWLSTLLPKKEHSKV